MLDKKTMVTMLRENNDGCEVKFRKVDGTERIMWCTLNANLLPKVEEKPKSEKPKKVGLTESDDHVVAWDLEKNAWRSFRCDSVLMFSRERIAVQK